MFGGQFAISFMGKVSPLGAVGTGTNPSSSLVLEHVVFCKTHGFLHKNYITTENFRPKKIKPKNKKPKSCLKRCLDFPIVFSLFKEMALK